MMVIPKKFGDDAGKGVLLAVPGGTQMIFNTYLWHSATPFRASEGQRYSVTRIYDRADHYWEGVRHYTNLESVEPSGGSSARSAPSSGSCSGFPRPGILTTLRRAWLRWRSITQGGTRVGSTRSQNSLLKKSKRDFGHV